MTSYFGWLAVAAVASAIATPARSEIRQFNIPAGPLKHSLDRFARQSGKQLIYRSEEIRAARSTSVIGRRTVEAALSALLEGTGFSARAEASGAIAIVRSRGKFGAGPSILPPYLAASAREAAMVEPEVIIVTGSRIPQPNLESASPVAFITSHEVKISGTSRTEDAINALPQAYADQGANISNGASGTATANLRGLGPGRSLVLIDGKRLQAGDMLSPYPDLNFIPQQLIKRVDVLTGGASSVYGADAVAGVVNFILDTTFTGFRIDGQASVFNHRNDTNSDIIEANQARGLQPPRGWSTNGNAQDIAGTFGADLDGGRGHVTAYATYRIQDAVLQSSRDYSFCALGAFAAPAIEATGRRFVCGGPMAAANAAFVQIDPVTLRTIGIFQVEGHTFAPGFQPFNPAPFNYFQRPDERYNLGAFAFYEISAASTPYFEAMFMDDRSVSQIAPSGNFGDTATIACDNAMLSPQQAEWICGTGKTFFAPLNGQANVEQAFVYAMRRNVEGGGRDDVIAHTAYRIIGGMRGNAARGVSYDAYYQFGRTLRSSTYLNDFSVLRLGRAIDAVRDASGNIICRAVLTGIDPTCVPYDIFRDGGVTQAALQYLQTPGFQHGAINETIAHVDMTIRGDAYAWRLPWAETGVTANIGAEYRKEFLDFKVDERFRTGDLAGQGPTPPVQGQFDVRELFAELELPIVRHQVIDELTLNAGYRYSSYRVAGNSFDTDTYRIAAELAPIADIRLRGSYNRAVRAPNIVELFFPQSLGFASAADPCANQPGGTPRWTLAQCQLTGVVPSMYGYILPSASGQYNALFGGNPNILPEKADTYTLGVILQPRFIPGLALTADYFDIRVSNVIGAPGFTATLEACAGVNAPSDASACALIRRSSTGSLWLGTTGFVDLTNRNFPGIAIQSSGIDFQGSYSRRIGGFGTATAAFIGTYVSRLRAPGVFDDCAGLFGGTCGTPNPKWRHKLRIGLTTPSDLGLFVGWRHFSGVDAQPSVNPADARLSEVNYLDLALTANLPGGMNLRVGANNVLDREPPIAGGVIGVGFGNGNTYPQVYDALGRYLFAAFTVEF